MKSSGVQRGRQLPPRAQNLQQTGAAAVRVNTSEIRIGKCRGSDRMDQGEDCPRPPSRHTAVATARAILCCIDPSLARAPSR
eukprot:9653835-Alexandrium_andersonii.AAC.1